MSTNYNCWIRTTINEVRIASNNQIYIKGKRGVGVYPEVRFINSSISFYVPKIGDSIIMWFPDSSMDIQFCFATFFNNNLNGLYVSGEGEVGIVESLIQFFKNKLNFKATKASFSQCDTIEFKEGGKYFLNMDAAMQVTTSTGTYTVNIINAGQNKVKG